MKTNILYLFAFVLLFSACSNDDALNNLTVYEEGNIKITLINVIDGRCPENANCTWQGNAEVLMEFEKGNQLMEFKLNTAGMINEEFNFPISATILNLNIALIDLQPYPVSVAPIPLEDYVISLEVTE